MTLSGSNAIDLVSKLVSGQAEIHAVLFYGEDGGGMLDQGLNLAQGWLCHNPENGSACGTCGVCKSFLAGRMVDFMHYKPWGPSSLIKLDAIRPPQKNKKRDDDAPVPNLIEYFRTPPLMARHKVAMFDRADRLTHDSANALLKTLEEPPAFAKVILVTGEYSRLLPTVRSRCMGVACSYALDPEADAIAATFGPSPGLYERIQKHRKSYEQLWTVLESSRTAPPGAAVALSERMRDVSDKLADALKGPARAGHSEALRCMAEWLVRNRTDRPELAQAAVEAHRRVVGNVNAGPLLDALWAQVTAP